MTSPHVTDVHTTVTRQINIDLTADFLMTSTAGQFRPDRLAITITNDQIDILVVGGPVIRADGTPHSSGRRGTLPLSPADPNLPDWVQNLVEQYGPAGRG